MADRIIKDIRIYESENVAGKSLPSDLGKVFESTENTIFIGIRIARKLNELKYCFGEFDHIYINLTTYLKENEIQISNRDLDKRIKYIDLGTSSTYFNSLKTEEKDEFIERKIIEIFRRISTGQNLEFVNKTAIELSKFKREVKIHYKTKETKTYRIVIYYQIAPINKSSNAIIEYHDKENNITYTINFELRLYADIYSLIDNIGVKNNKITLKPKKSFSAQLVCKYYKTPLEFDLK